VAPALLTAHLLHQTGFWLGVLPLGSVRSRLEHRRTDFGILAAAVLNFGRWYLQEGEAKYTQTLNKSFLGNLNVTINLRDLNTL